jgi:protein involved in polysaccharide export with SLBB domain
MKLLRHVLTCRRMRLGLAVLALAVAPGCAALTNPVADGIPVSRLPDEVFGESREGFKPVPLNLLGQEPPDVYRLAAGDVLGIVIEGVLGEKNAPPPIHLESTERAGALPAFGYPVLVQEDGTINVPFVDPVKVSRLTLAEARDALIIAYTKKKEILKPENARIMVSLMRPRRIHVQVFREDSGSAGVPAGPGLGNGIGASLVGASRKGTAASVELPAYENDVLNALNRSGGLPGTDAKNEVIVQRKPRRGQTPETIRIPLRLRPGEPVPFRPEDVILQAGDTVIVEARNAEVFYTAGLLGSGQYPLPRDYDLDVIQAIATVRGPLINGGFSQGAFGGQSSVGGIGGPNPSQVTVVRQAGALGQIPIRVDLNKAFRDRRERIRLLPGDILVLQETSEEAITQYLIQAFRFNLAAPVLRAGDVAATSSGSVP